MDTSSGDASVFVDVVEAEAGEGASGVSAPEPERAAAAAAGKMWLERGKQSRGHPAGGDSPIVPDAVGRRSFSLSSYGFC